MYPPCFGVGGADTQVRPYNVKVWADLGVRP